MALFRVRAPHVFRPQHDARSLGRILLRGCRCRRGSLDKALADDALPHGRVAASRRLHAAGGIPWIISLAASAARLLFLSGSSARVELELMPGTKRFGTALGQRGADAHILAPGTRAFPVRPVCRSCSISGTPFIKCTNN